MVYSEKSLFWSFDSDDNCLGGSCDGVDASFDGNWNDSSDGDFDLYCKSFCCKTLKFDDFSLELNEETDSNQVFSSCFIGCVLE